MVVNRQIIGGLRASFLAASALIGASCGRPPAVVDPVQREFWNALRAYCGQAFEGTVTEAAGSDTVLIGQPLVLDVWQCYAREVRLAFHVGNDHSRVWLVTPEPNGLRLGHQLHDADGEAGTLSGYGGVTAEAGTATRQRFLPDDRTLFGAPGVRGASWSLEIEPTRRISYLFEPADRLSRFRVDFDLTRRAARAPAPWGFTRTRERSAPAAGR